MKDAYTIALHTEDEGHALYTRAASQSGHPLGREILSFLAKEELKHTAVIKHIVAKIQDGGRFEKEDFPLDARRGATIFTDALKDPRSRLPGTQDDLAVLQEAIRFETDGIAFFTKAAAETTNAEERRFYEAMAREERSHRILLESSVQYLEDPENWFAQDGQIHLDGA